MADFTPINTQEELNNIIGERLRRERETVTREVTQKFEQQISAKDSEITAKDGEIAKYKTDMEALNQQLTDANGKISGIPALEEKIRGYERASVKSKVAREVGIPYELAERLSGETEEDIRKDAEGMRKLIGAMKPGAPLANGERGTANQNITKNKWREVAKKFEEE